MFLFNGVLFPVYMVLNAQSWKQLWKSSDVTLLSTFAVFSFICSKVSNRVRFYNFLISGNSKKLQGAKSHRYRKCSCTGIFLSTKNCFTDKVLWGIALSW